MMGLTMAERRAVTTAIATRYKRADKPGKAKILGRTVCHDRLASRPCPQGAADGPVSRRWSVPGLRGHRGMGRTLLRR